MCAMKKTKEKLFTAYSILICSVSVGLYQNERASEWEREKRKNYNGLLYMLASDIMMQFSNSYATNFSRWLIFPWLFFITNT